MKRFVLVGCAVVLTVMTVFSQSTADPALRITRDDTAHTITFSNHNFTAVYCFDHQSTVSAFRYGSAELLGKSGLCSSLQVEADGSILSSRQLSESPIVTVDKNLVTADFSMSNPLLTVKEKWVFQLGPKAIDLAVSRSYQWKNSFLPTKLRRNVMVEINWRQLWDNIRRPEDGGNFPLGNAYAGQNGMYLNVSGERTGVEQGSFVFLDNETKLALAQTSTGSGNLATEFSCHGDGQIQQEALVSAAKWSYTAGTEVNGLVIGGHSAIDNTFIYGPVAIGQKQQDSVSFTFAPVDYDQYYSLGGQLKGISDPQALASLLHDFGRSDIIDKGYGFSTVGIYQTGQGAYDSPYFLPLMEGLFDQGAVESQKNQLIYNRDYAQEASGHLNGRTFHRDTPWTHDCLMDSDPAYALSVARVFEYSPDTQWLMSMRESVEKALAFMIKNYLDDDGLFNNGVANTTDHQFLREWNDIFFISNKSAYINLLMYNALRHWTEIEKEIIHNGALADSFSRLADKLFRQFNKNTADGGFWCLEHNTYVYWRDRDGSVHGDVIQAQINLMAIEAGLADLDRAKLIMQTIDDQMAKTKLKLLPENFLDYPAADFPDPPAFSGINKFKTGVENGAIYPLFVQNYMAAAWRIGEPEKSLPYLENCLSRYKQDGFYGFSHLDWNLEIPKGFQEKWFPVNANAGAGVYKWLLGIQPTRKGLTIAPNLPRAMTDSQVALTIRGTEKVMVRYLSPTRLDINWSSAVLPVTVRWSGQIPGAVRTIRDNGLLHQVTVDADGFVNYSYTGRGPHLVQMGDK